MTAIKLYDTMGGRNKYQHLSVDGETSLCGQNVNRKTGLAPIPPVTLSDLESLICKQCWKAHQKAGKS